MLFTNSQCFESNCNHNLTPSTPGAKDWRLNLHLRNTTEHEGLETAEAGVEAVVGSSIGGKEQVAPSTGPESPTSYTKQLGGALRNFHIPTTVLEKALSPNV